MEILQAWLDASDMPVITAFLLGLLTATSPCPLATNITAIGFISKDIEDKQRILLHGILYAIGRIVAYSLLGILLIYMLRGGIDTFNLQSSISRWGELLVAPLLLIIGVLMLVDVRMPLSKLGFGVSDRAERLRGKCGALLFGNAVCNGILSNEWIVLLWNAHSHVCFSFRRLCSTCHLCSGYRIACGGCGMDDSL